MLDLSRAFVTCRITYTSMKISDPQGFTGPVDGDSAAGPLILVLSDATPLDLEEEEQRSCLSHFPQAHLCSVSSHLDNSKHSCVPSSLFLADPGSSVCATWEKKAVWGTRALQQEKVENMLLFGIRSHSEMEGACLIVRSIPLSPSTSKGKLRNMAAPG